MNSRGPTSSGQSGRLDRQRADGTKMLSDLRSDLTLRVARHGAVELVDVPPQAVFVLGSARSADVHVEGEPLQASIARSAEGVALVSRLGDEPIAVGSTVVLGTAVPVTFRQSTLRLPEADVDLSSLVRPTVSVAIRARWFGPNDDLRLRTLTAGNCTAATFGPREATQVAAMIDSFSGVGTRSAVWALEPAVEQRPSVAAACVIGISTTSDGEPALLIAAQSSSVRLRHRHLGPVPYDTEGNLHTATIAFGEGRIWLELLDVDDRLLCAAEVDGGGEGTATGAAALELR